MPTFRILRQTQPPVIECQRCFERTRLWDDRQAAKWKAAHAVNCPLNVMAEKRSEESTP